MDQPQENLVITSQKDIIRKNSFWVVLINILETKEDLTKIIIHFKNLPNLKSILILYVR